MGFEPAFSNWLRTGLLLAVSKGPVCGTGGGEKGSQRSALCLRFWYTNDDEQALGYGRGRTLLLWRYFTAT